MTVTTTDLVAAVGVTYRQVDYWVRAGLLRTARPVEGTGNRRRFHVQEIHVARVVAALYALGADHELARPVAAAVRAHPDRPLTAHIGLYVVEITDHHLTVTVPLAYGDRRATA